MPHLMHSLLSEASAKGARSTALHAMQWTIGMIFALIPLLLLTSAPPWLLVSAALTAGLVLLVFLVAYLFLLVKDRDALRSESFSLSKLAIEKGLVGDSAHGLIDITQRKQGDATNHRALTSDQGNQE